MSFKSYEKRLKEKYDLDALCKVAGYISANEITSQDYNPKSRIQGLARGILINKDRIEKFMQDDGDIFNQVFLRELGDGGVEIFYFQNKYKWSQEKQKDREGLVYFCLPNRTRLDHEEVFTRSVTHMQDLESPKSKKSEKWKEAWLNLDRMYPDKWGHMALEILLRQANQD